MQLSNRSAAASVILALALASCGDDSEAQRHAERQRENTEYSIKADAAREAELRLLNDPTSAAAEVKRRLDDWLTVDTGGVVLTKDEREKGFRIYVMPRNSPWMIEFTGRGLEVVIGHLLDGGMRPPEATSIQKMLTRTQLSREQCMRLSLVVGQHLRQIFDK